MLEILVTVSTFQGNCSRKKSLDIGRRMNSLRSRTRKNRVLRNTRGRFLAKQPRNSKGRYTYRVKSRKARRKH